MEIHDEKVKLIHEIYNGFLRDEFSRDVGKGTEYLHRVSEKIAKDYYDLPPRVVQDAWAYVSVQDKKKYNVCFRPELAHELLEVNGVMMCKRNNDRKMQFFCITDGSDVKGKIMFYPMVSDIQKKIFPELIPF